VKKVKNKGKEGGGGRYQIDELPKDSDRGVVKNRSPGIEEKNEPFGGGKNQVGGATFDPSYAANGVNWRRGLPKK